VLTDIRFPCMSCRPCGACYYAQSNPHQHQPVQPPADGSCSPVIDITAVHTNKSYISLCHRDMCIKTYISITKRHRTDKNEMHLYTADDCANPLLQLAGLRPWQFNQRQLFADTAAHVQKISPVLHTALATSSAALLLTAACCQHDTSNQTSSAVTLSLFLHRTDACCHI
jgi:hypothetical protein